MQCTLCETSYVGKYQHVWWCEVHSIVEGSEACMWTMLNDLPHSYVRLTMHSKSAFIHKFWVCISRGRELSCGRLGSGSLDTCVRHNTCILSVAVIFALSKAMPHIVSAHTHTHTSSFTYNTDLHSLSLSPLSFTRYFEIDKISARPANKSHVRSDSY